MTMSNQPVCVIRLRNYVLHATPPGFYFSTSARIYDTIPTQEIRSPFMDGRFVSFHIVPEDSHMEMNTGPSSIDGE